jgi:hypothetical protein
VAGTGPRHLRQELHEFPRHTPQAQARPRLYHMNRRTVYSILVAYVAGIVRGGAKWQAVVNLKLFEVQAHVEIQGTPQPETPNPELSWHCCTSAPRAAVQNRSQTLTIAGGAAGATREFLHQTECCFIDVKVALPPSTPDTPIVKATLGDCIDCNVWSARPDCARGKERIRW